MANVLGELFQDIADAIRSKTGSTDTLKPNQFPAAIEGITTGGGSSADVRYVTFRNESTGEEYKKPVAYGDDCVDVVAKGLWKTPTKESTAQYNYTFYGWGATDGGAADANILKNITEDKTVYAIFTATVRHYTITWLDEDGVTELPGQKQWAYGTVPSYAPVKEGYTLSSWTPTPVKVTGDATYTASWEEDLSFSASPWAKIAQIAEGGNAAAKFSIGDEKTFENNGVTYTAKIVGFNHDDLADGSGKAGITMMIVPGNYNQLTWWSNTYVGYNGSTPDTYAKKTEHLPSELVAVLKTVKKKQNNKHSGKWNDLDRVGFCPAATELGYSLSGYEDEGAAYALFDGTSASRIANHADGTAIPYWTRTQKSSNNPYYVTTSGSVTTATFNKSGTAYVISFYCI